MQINEKAHPAAFPKARTSTSYNIAYGAAILRDGFRRYGSWKAAIAAYNWGSAQYRRGGNGAFVNETYVVDVLKAARRFSGAKSAPARG